ncbi:O-Antigen ligase [Planctomycetes bacterium CA13]|uniref:O-Antigen ligase n=1 Tax=Novipirellula herctigrandis TaxID=2527986 RepID=A0A5C5YVW4_9BACT|nr:O-Antigen ligase [Planctomycetes bacterium CA13]
MKPQRTKAAVSVPTPQNHRDLFALAVVRAIVLVSLIYGAWHYGGVHAVALQRLSWLSVIGLIAALGVTETWSRRSNLMPKVFLFLLAGWLAYGWIQFAPTPSVLEPWFDRADQQTAHFLESIDSIGKAAKNLDEVAASRIQSLENTQTNRGSVVATLTQHALVPYQIAMALAVLAAIGFRTDNSKRWLLWTIILNGTAIAVWGIVQRAGNGSEILPGIENHFDGNPFGSFIYKNAGAAALLPAIVSLVILSLVNRPKQSDGTYRQTRTAGRSVWTKQMRTMMTMIQILLGGILVTGLIASLSRAAWAALLVAMIAISFRLGVSIKDRRIWVVLLGLVGLLIAVSLTTGISDTLQTRAGQVNLKNVSADERWEQWRDGFDAALANLPSGSGLGTYGYASLPFQSKARRSWFREAHNQYLEVFEEMGLVGISIIIAGMLWFSIISYRLSKTKPAKGFRGETSNTTNLKMWGIIGIAILVCGSVQSIVDFVLKIPANLILYSVMISVVAVSRQAALESMSPKLTVAEGTRLRKFGMLAGFPLPWVLVGIVMAIVGISLSGKKIRGDACLASIVRDDSSDVVSLEQLDNQLVIVDRAIAEAPLRVDLYAARARVDLLRYRKGLVQVAANQGVAIKLANTEMGAIHPLLMSQSPANRELLRDEFLTDQILRESLAAVLVDLHGALRLNPYHPHTHLRLAMIAPLAGFSTSPWLQNSVALGNNSPDILFDNGLVAYYGNDTETMIDQWSKALSISHERLQTILDVSSERASLVTVVERLVPATRPDQIIDLIKKRGEDSIALSGDSEVAEVRDYLDSSDRFDEVRRHVTLAGLNDLLDQPDAAAEHWKKALRLSPLDVHIRLSLAQSLLAGGHPNEALDQAVLGQRLFPDETRFKNKADAIRREIRSRN